MPPSKNQIAATMTKGQATEAGVIDANQAVEHITTNSKKQYGFTRKMLPVGLPTEPKMYIYSVSLFGAVGPDAVNLGPGFKLYEVPPCHPGEDYGEPCIIDPINFFEEAKVDVTEHTFTSGQQIAEAILKIGPGMNAANDRRKQGWFMSLSNPPEDHEVEKAVQIYTQECKRLFQEGNRHATSGRPNAMDEVNETHRRAAAYLGERVDWDKPTTKMMDCPWCKDRINAGAMVHIPCGWVSPNAPEEVVARHRKSA